MTRLLIPLVVAGLLGLGPGAGVAQAVLITFEVTDLADTTPGEDLWRYSYVVTEFSPGENLAFETLFDISLYRALEDPPPGVGGWDILTLQPDPLLPDVGRYSALALADGASLAEPFLLTFVWLGGPGTAPGIQPFEIVEFDVDGNFIATLETGFTTPATPRAVPEPGTLVLALAGLLGLGLVRHRWKV
jgi:hypothetical protein